MHGFYLTLTTLICKLLRLRGMTIDINTQPTQAVMYASIDSLIQIAISQSQQSAGPDSTSSAWKTLRDIPLGRSAAESLGGMLLAVGGRDDDYHSISPPSTVSYPDQTTRPGTEKRVWSRDGSSSHGTLHKRDIKLIDNNPEGSVIMTSSVFLRTYVRTCT